MARVVGVRLSDHQFDRFGCLAASFGMSQSALGAILIDFAMSTADLSRLRATEDGDDEGDDSFAKPDDRSEDRVLVAKRSAALYDRVSTRIGRNRSGANTASNFHNAFGIEITALMDALANLTYDELKELLPNLETLPSPIDG